MLKFIDVSKKYKDTIALNNFSCEIKKAEIHGLLGHNGSGKTTSFLIANKMLEFSSGNVYINGKNINDLSNNEIQKIGLLTEQLKIYDDLTIRESLNFFCRVFNIKNITLKIDEISKIFDFDKYIDKRVNTLSTGMYKKVIIALTFINDPSLVFLDEPFSGLDPVIVKQISRILIKYKKENGTTIIVSSHNLHEIEEIADRVTIMKDGVAIVSETLNDLYRKFNLKKNYSISYLDVNIEKTKLVNEEQELLEFLSYIKENDLILLKISEGKVKLADIYNQIYSTIV